jgi:cell division septation protein DedD
MDAMGTMRDLDQIREHDDAGGSSRLMSLAMGGLATACVLFAVGVMVGRESGDGHPSTREDPLARLDQLAQQQPEATAQITWPERLTGPGANAAAATAAPAAAAAPLPPGFTVTSGTPAPSAPVLLGSVGAPSSMTVRLSGAPLAAPSGLAGAPLAAPVAAGAPASAGSEGAFSVQVSSFRSITAAQQFSTRLRERGHRAFVAPPATAPNGVVWHRVRIGPFTTQREAATYRTQFEARERMPTIVVRRDQEPFHTQPAH